MMINDDPQTSIAYGHISFNKIKLEAYTLSPRKKMSFTLELNITKILEIKQIIFSYNRYNGFLITDKIELFENNSKLICL